MSRGPVVATLVASLILGVVAVACETSDAGPTGPVGSAPPRVGAITVVPPSGPLGTTFTLTAKGVKAGEAVAFEITFPGEGKAYPGAALAVPADGITTTTYRATTANQPGNYIVRLTGAPGILAEGRFVVTDGPPLTSAIDTLPTTTNTKVGRTTTSLKGGSTTSTSPKPSSSTTPKATTTSSTAASSITTA